MSVHKPSWFSDDTVMVSTAPTCGLTKGGRILPLVDESGHRVQVTDTETGEVIDAVNDALLEDLLALRKGETTDTLRFVPAHEVTLRSAVPVYYDRRHERQFDEALGDGSLFAGFTTLTIGEMLDKELLTIRGGHGSPTQEQRVGDIPYIKVSDLRAGTININPTNRVPRAVAESSRFWGGSASGLSAYDLISPERTSKNIGDFCVLMPGQEQVVVTKEVIILRPGPKADFDAFYLLWALTLKIVRDQWKRVVFMQTNREDVGKRYYEIKLPIAPSADVAREVSAPFRAYYTALAAARENFTAYLMDSGRHHFFITGGESLAVDDEEAAILEATEIAEGTVLAADDEARTEEEELAQAAPPRSL